MTFHNFNGLNADGLRKYRECIEGKIDQAKSRHCYFRVGLLLHALGDAYAHVQQSGDAYENGGILGHSTDLTMPDNVQEMVVLSENGVNESYYPLGEVRFRRGFVIDPGLRRLIGDVVETTTVSYPLHSLLDDLYMENSLWNQLLFFQGTYKNNGSTLLRNYANQFYDLHTFDPNMPVLSEMINVKSFDCMESEANAVRFMLLDCLRSSGWKWPK